MALENQKRIFLYISCGGRIHIFVFFPRFVSLACHRLQAAFYPARGRRTAFIFQDLRNYKSERLNLCLSAADSESYL